mgnify:CR=1 FL=1
MRVREVLAELRRVGEAAGVRKTYFVFRGPRHYLLRSFKTDDAAAGNANIVDREAVAYAEERFRSAKGLITK